MLVIYKRARNPNNEDESCIIGCEVFFYYFEIENFI